MLILIPLLASALLLQIWSFSSEGLRQAFIKVSITWSVLLVFSTEILSLFKLLNLTGVLATWSTLCLILGFWLIRQHGWRSLIPPWHAMETASLGPISLRVGLCMILGITAIIALVSPPNTFDSMSYHMPRVVEWIQNEGIQHFPTQYLHQLYHPPFTEFVITHLQILSDGDWYANLVQWFSLLGSLVAVSLVVEALGASKNDGLLAVVLVATIPVVILQASSTYNDLTLAFWLLVFAYWVLRLRQPTTKRSDILLAAASLALAILSKATAYLYVFPFCIWLALICWSRLRFKAWRPIALVGIVVLVLNAGHYLRNYDLFGSPMGPSASSEHLNQVYSLPAFTSNFLRNISNHLASPSQQINNALESIVVSIHNNFIGIDVNDVRTTFLAPRWYYDLSNKTNHDHFAPSTFHLALFTLATVLLIIGRKANSGVIRTYFLAIMSGIGLLILFIQWQYIHTRLHLPFFVLSAPFIAIVLSKWLSRRQVWLLGHALILLSIPVLFEGALRPIVRMPYHDYYETAWFVEPLLQNDTSFNIFSVSRDQLYFADNPSIAKPYMETADIIAGQSCFDIGIDLEPSGAWAYMFWTLLWSRQDISPDIRYVNVQNVSRQKTAQDFSPCLLINVSSQVVNNVTLDGTPFSLLASNPYEDGSLYINLLTKESIGESA